MPRKHFSLLDWAYIVALWVCVLVSSLVFVGLLAFLWELPAFRLCVGVLCAGTLARLGFLWPGSARAVLFGAAAVLLWLAVQVAVHDPCDARPGVVESCEK